MARTIDFSKLSTKDALDMAILIEEEAAERYEELAGQMEAHHTPEAAEFFRTMIRNEKRHGAELAERRKARFGDAAIHVDRSMLWEVEAPGYETVGAFMSTREALEVALAAEKKAYEFFVEALRHTTDPEVRTLFEELKEEEVMHQNLVNRELEKVPPSDSIDRSEFADEPVAQ